MCDLFRETMTYTRLLCVFVLHVSFACIQIFYTSCHVSHVVHCIQFRKKQEILLMHRYEEWYKS